LEGAFGDNDELSALLATAVKADWLLPVDECGWFFLFPTAARSPGCNAWWRKLTPALEAQMQRQEQG